MSERRIVFKLGDFIEFKSHKQQLRVGRINGIFVHNMLSEDKVFAQVTDVVESGSFDEILSLRMLKVAITSRIVGLPMITARRLYIVPVKEEDGEVSFSTVGEDLIWVDWTVQYL